MKHTDLFISQSSDGYDALLRTRQAIATGNSGAEAASEWLFGHMEDPDINDPPARTSRRVVTCHSRVPHTDGTPVTQI